MMIKTQTKTFLFVTVVFVLFSSLGFYSFHLYEHKRLQSIQVKSYQHLEIFYKHLLKDYKFFYRHMLQEISTSDAMKASIANKNREKLFQLNIPFWSRLKQEDLRSNVIHYHLPNGNSFLRMHKPSKYDDNISLLRAMPRYMHQHHKIIFGFEQGVYQLAYRAFAPLFYQGNYIGAVEFGSRPDYILDHLREFQDIRGFIFVKKSALKLYKEAVSPLSIGRHVLQYSNFTKGNQLAIALKKQGYDFQNLYGFEFQNKHYNIYSFDMNDFQNKSIAKILLVQDVSKVYRDFAQQLRYMVVVVFLITGLILIIIHFGFKSLIGKIDLQNTQLQEHQKELTTKVDKQVEIINQKESFIRQQSKMVEMGNMIGAIAHQWKQPLHIVATMVTDLSIKLMIQQCHEARSWQECMEERDALIQKYLENISMEIKFMNQTIEDFKNFLKPSKEKTDFSVLTEIKAVERILKPILEKNNITIIIENNEIENDTIQGYPTEFAQVILNLINNAKDAIISNNPDNRNILIKLSQNSHSLKIAIQDYAGGMSQEVYEHLFQSYYTTKGDEGTGIGLSIVKDIVHNMHGKIYAQNSQGGALFEIEIAYHN